MLTGDLSPGFAEPVHGAQQTFRAVLDAMARPGSVCKLDGVATAPAPLTPTLAAVALTLLDHDTPVCLCRPFDAEDVLRYLAFHTGAPVINIAGEADFVLGMAGQHLPDPMDLKAGTSAYPDRSATLLIAVEGFGAGDPVTLSGPGIEEAAEFSAAGLDARFWAAARRNRARYPLGVDFLFCGPGAIAGLPRSTAIAV